jgi:hypothetical protein
MKKLINHPDSVLAESLDGFAAAHRDIVKLGPQRKFVQRTALKKGKVALISGGVPVTNQCMRDSLATGCLMRPVRAKSSLHPHPIR